MICPVCGWRGLVRRTIRRRIYCSNACKSRARCQPELDPAENDESSDWLPLGSLSSEIESNLAAAEPIWCDVCGRPLGHDEDFGPWRVRAVRHSALWHFVFHCTCPLHFAAKEAGEGG